MPTFVLEVGTEEMPAGAIGSALEQLREGLAARLAEARLPATSVRTVGTPRRLIAIAEGVPDRQPDVEREVRGPARSVAFGADGKPTGAAIGFARKQGVGVDALEILSTPQGEYVQARVVDLGRPAAEALGGPVVESIKALTFPKLMRWGSGMRFVRPVRWMLALLGPDVVAAEFCGVPSGRRSRGHRYLAPEEFDVPEAESLVGLLRDRFVMVDPVERRGVIREQANALAAEAGGSVPWDDELLDENVYLVEWPTALLGAFAPEFLDLPRPVLVTAMKKHQRFFPVEDAAGRLLPCFIAVRNGGSEHLDFVRGGNERVLTSRFADASYFYGQDKETSLDEMAAGLDRLVFQEKLGTMADKRARLGLLAPLLAASHGLSRGEIALATRAAALCKADLVSRMVVELPALQGIIGREYALAAGEDPSTAAAVAEHYRPKSAGDSVPESKIGKLLAVADRIDTLVGYVGLGIMPSGSSDPFGLRRAAQGVIQILADEPDVPSLAEMQVEAAKGYQQVNALDFELDPLCNNLRTLFDQRISGYLSDLGVRYDLIDAALSGGLVYGSVVYCVVTRARTLQSLADDPAFVPTVQAAARVTNILRSAETEGMAPLVPGKEGIHGGPALSVERAVALLDNAMRSVSALAFVEPAEQALFDAACRLAPEVGRATAAYEFGKVYGALGSLRTSVDGFFDDVMVMVDDRAVRKNRLALLTLVDTLYKTLADFTKVVVQ